MALMPSETSAQISNATNGIEPPRSFVSVKQSKDGVLKQVVPGIHKLKSKYDLLGLGIEPRSNDIRWRRPQPAWRKDLNFLR